MNYEPRTVNYKPYIIFVSIMAAGVSAIFLVSQGYYPIALIQNSFVTARTFNEEYHAALLFYQNASKTYGSLLSGSSTLTNTEIQASVMDKLVEGEIIRDGAEKEVGKDLLDELVEGKINKYADDADLTKAAAVLYGLDGKAFIADVLAPEATREVLDSRLVLKGEKMGDWLLQAKKSARVIIFSPQFSWDGVEVKSK